MGYAGAVFDVDGTVVRGNTPLPGATEGYRQVCDAGIDSVFVSNNPTKRPSAYVDRLGNAGFDVTVDRVLTAGTVTTEYLQRHHEDDDLFVIGDEGVIDQLTDGGLSVTDSADDGDVLVASIDRGFTYEDLRDALWALERDIPFIGTDPDMVIPAAERNVPGSGAVIHAIAGVTQRDPDIVLGKPSAPAIEMVAQRLGHPPAECFIVGDRLDTDIAFGERAGMTTVLVTTGITNENTLSESPYEPDYVLDSLAEIDRVLSGV